MKAQCSSCKLVYENDIYLYLGGKHCTACFDAIMDERLAKEGTSDCTHFMVSENGTCSGCHKKVAKQLGGQA